MRRATVTGSLVRLAGLACATQAWASCYEEIGCTKTDRYSAKRLGQLASCQILWEMRNGVYAENGYCFKTRRAISLFGNEQCRFANIDQVPLNAVERANISALVQAERANGCK